MSENGEPESSDRDTTTQPPLNEITVGNGTSAEEAPFMGAEMCQSPTQAEATNSDYVPLATVQQRAAGAWNLNGAGSALADVPLELPFSPASDGAPSDLAWMENLPWKKEDVPVPPFAYQQNPYAYTRPSKASTTTSRFPLHHISMTRSTMPNNAIGSLRPGPQLDIGRSISNAPGSVCTTQGLLSASVSRKEEICRLAQNPFGSSAVFCPQSISQDMYWWQTRCQEPVHETGTLFQQRSLSAYDALWREKQPVTMYSKYQGRRTGIFRRLRKKIMAIGGRICQNFFIWVFFVAALAAVEGYKGKSEAEKREVAGLDWSDSETEQDHGSKINVLSFKG